MLQGRERGGMVLAASNSWCRQAHAIHRPMSVHIQLQTLCLRKSGFVVVAVAQDLVTESLKLRWAYWICIISNWTADISEHDNNKLRRGLQMVVLTVQGNSVMLCPHGVCGWWP